MFYFLGILNEGYPGPENSPNKTSQSFNMSKWNAVSFLTLSYLFNTLHQKKHSQHCLSSSRSPHSEAVRKWRHQQKLYYFKTFPYKAMTLSISSLYSLKIPVSAAEEGKGWLVREKEPGWASANSCQSTSPCLHSQHTAILTGAFLSLLH